MVKKNHIVFTTIFDISNMVMALKENLEKFNHLDDTKVWVVGDKKTPSMVKEICDSVSRLGLETVYLSIKNQDKWGKLFPDFYKRIPYNNETRRNIGYLFALEDGCERIISIDDDNLPTDDDFIGGHSATGKIWTSFVVNEESGFYNICEYLKFNTERAIYPRGFPFRLRGTKNMNLITNIDSYKIIGVTEGLWIGEPDVDATVWINGKVLSLEYTGPNLVVLNQNVLSPINTQNTSVIRDLIPAFFCIPMGWSVPGGKIQRYGDIWGGYFLQAVMKGTNFYAAFGKPIVNHKRNLHNYLDDLRHEFWGMMLTDYLLQILYEDFNPTDTDICDRMEHLSDFLYLNVLSKLPSWCTREVKEFIIYTAGNIYQWSKVCRKILA